MNQFLDGRPIVWHTLSDDGVPRTVLYDFNCNMAFNAKGEVLGLSQNIDDVLARVKATAPARWPKTRRWWKNV